MPFERSEDQQMLTDTVRRYADEVLRDRAESHDREGRVSDDVRRGLAELGLFGLLAPAERGGLDAPPTWALGAVEELAAADPAVAWLCAGQMVALGVGEADGDAALSGRVWWAVASATGTVPAVDPETVVWSTEGGWVQAPGPEGLQPAGGCLGLRGARLGRTPKPRQPPSAFGRRLWLGEALAGAVALGAGRDAMAHAVRYAQQRTQFGRPIADFQAVQWKIADRMTALDGARLLLTHSVETEDGPGVHLAARRAGREGVEAAYDAIQIFGGNGFIREYPVERLLRDTETVAAWLLASGSE